jgi:hypothetical protein
MWFNWFGISKKRYSDIVDEWEKWRPWCTRVSTSFSSAFTVGWMPLDAGRSSSSTDNGFSDDVALIREWRNSNTWNCLCFSIKKQMNSIWNVFWDIKWNVCTWCPVVWFSLPKKKTERLSLPYWLAPTCGHCSVSNNWAYRVERGDQTHTFGRLVIINEPLNLRKTKMGYFSSVISVDSSKWMLITRNGWSSYDGGRNSGGVGQQIVMRIRINTTHRRQLGRWRAVTKLWARHQISGSRSVFFQQE